MKLRYLVLTGLFLSQSSQARVFDVEFNDSMQYKSPEDEKNILREFCKNLYEKNNLLEPQKDPIIPKIVHLIWVGPLTPPPIFEDCLEAIRTYLPEWKCMIWKDKEVADFGLHNQQFYDEEHNYGAKADIARYEILHRFGGVYLDVDFILLQPLDILHHTYEFYAGVHPANCKAILGNCVIGSVPGHPILKDLIDTLKNYRKKTADPVRRTGPIPFQNSFFSVAKQHPDAKIISLPRSFFFPLDQKQRRLKQAQIDALIKPETFAMHFWAGTWKKGILRQRPKK